MGNGTYWKNLYFVAHITSVTQFKYLFGMEFRGRCEFSEPNDTLMLMVECGRSLMVYSLSIMSRSD